MDNENICWYISRDQAELGRRAWLVAGAGCGRAPLGPAHGGHQRQRCQHARERLGSEILGPSGCTQGQGSAGAVIAGLVAFGLEVAARDG